MYNVKKLRRNLALGLSFGAMLGMAACGSFQMPEGMKAQGLFGEETTGTDAAEPGSGVHVPAQNAQPMASSQFEALKTQVADAGMANKKIALVEEAGASAYFSADQVGQLAALIDMKNQRVELVESIVERILDLDNSAAVTAMLTFADERADVESIMSKAQAARAKEETRLAEAERVAQEKRVAEAARIEQENRDAEAAQAAQASEAATVNSSSSTTTQSSSNSSAYCCINGKYNSCESAAAAGSCMGWGKCFFDCTVDGGSNCQDTCADEYPLIRQCQADASRDSQCAN